MSIVDHLSLNSFQVASTAKATLTTLFLPSPFLSFPLVQYVRVYIFAVELPGQLVRQARNADHALRQADAR